MKHSFNHHLSQNRKANYFIRSIFFAILMFVQIFCFSMNAHAEETNKIELLRAYEQPDGLYLDVQMQLELPQEVAQVLHKGVALHFSAQVEVKRERWYWFDATDASVNKSIKLSYQPLLQQYRVSIGTVGQSFLSLSEAMEVIGFISQWFIMDSKSLSISGQKKLNFTFELDHTLLPSSFQFGVSKNDLWRIKLTQTVDLQQTASEASYD